MKGKCFDKNLKVMLRKYRYENSIDEFKLCKIHSKDPDFSGYISETKLNEVIQN